MFINIAGPTESEDAEHLTGTKANEENERPPNVLALSRQAPVAHTPPN